MKGDVCRLSRRRFVLQLQLPRLYPGDVVIVVAHGNAVRGDSFRVKRLIENTTESA